VWLAGPAGDLRPQPFRYQRAQPGAGSQGPNLPPPPARPAAAAAKAAAAKAAAVLAKAAPAAVPATLVEDYSSYEYIARYTQNFSEERVLGSGVYGTVYHGIGGSPNFAAFAAKRLECSDEDQRRRLERMTQAEIRVLTTFAHPNIISLLGHCLHPDGAILVYDYQPGGSLDQKLRKVGEVPQLTWGRRSLIVSGLLAAVSYLHRHDPNGPCYHRDIKPANIMLTASLSPKLSDCGLSRFLPQDRPGQNRMTMQLTTGAGPAGTPGFMCRRYVSTGKFDEKSEVYSLGVTILQLITAEQGFSSSFEDLIELADAESILQGHDKGIPPENPVDHEILQKLCAMAVASVQPYLRRITVMPLLRQAQECSALQTPAEIPALKNELERISSELQRFRSQERAALQERKECQLCFHPCSGQGTLHCPNQHVICQTCASAMVVSHLERVSDSDTMLQQHRESGGRIPCARNNPAMQPRCTEFYTDQGLARALADEAFLFYRALQDEAVENRIWNEQNQRFQEQIQRRLLEQQTHQQQEADTVEFLRREYPNARMCPRCRCGPVTNERCFDLQSHHGQAQGRSRFNNACQQCGFFTPDWNQWLPWDGVLRGQQR